MDDRNLTTGRTEQTTTMTTRRQFLAAGVATSAMSVAGCLSLGGSSDETVTYRYRFSRNLSSTVIEGGIEMGVWEEEGLEVDFGTSSGADVAAQAVATGDDDFCQTGMASAVGMVEEGAPLTVIGQTQNPLGGVISLAEAGIHSWIDMEGKTIGRFPFGVQSNLAMAAFRSKGGNPDEVTLQNIDPGAQEVLLMEGKIDAAIAYFPQSVTRLEHEGYETNHLVTSQVLDHLGPSLATRDSLIDDKPEVVDSFVRGWLKAYRNFVTEIDELIEWHDEFVEEFNESVERETLPYIYASIVPDEKMGRSHGKGWISPIRLESTLDVLEEVAYVSNTGAPEDYATNQFIENNQDLAIETADVYYDALKEYDLNPDDV